MNKVGPYGAGYQSGLDGYSHDTNPYEDYTHAWDRWNDGWHKGTEVWECVTDDLSPPVTQWEAMLALI